MADLVNEFSWSRTRDNVFKGCRRRYYYQYYGAWGGWEAGADPLVRRLYVLKQLGTRQMWAGRLVHEAVERALLAMRDGHALSEAALIEDTVRQMRLEWRGSKDGVYREHPKRTGLFEQILAFLHLKMNEQGLIDWDLWEVDSTTIKASKAAAGAKKKPVNKL